MLPKTHRYEAGDRELEKREFVDQKIREVLALIESRPEIFAAQGTVVATWRTYGGRRLGPYFRLSFREGRRQRSLYLGTSAALAARVRAILARKHEPIKRRRTHEKIRSRAVVELRKHKVAWEARLHNVGLYAKGFEVRGWRRRQNTAITVTSKGRETAGEHVEDET